MESFTQEKVYIIAGPEFGELEGHTLIIIKALYGLHSSGLRWHERLSKVLRDAEFEPSTFWARLVAPLEEANKKLVAQWLLMAP